MQLVTTTLYTVWLSSPVDPSRKVEDEFGEMKLNKICIFKNILLFVLYAYVI